MNGRKSTAFFFTKDRAKDSTKFQTMLNVLKIYELRKKVYIRAQVQDVFSFFSRAENLNLITPPWLRFQILTPLPVKMEKQTRIDYSLNLFRIRLSWKTEITEWQPPFLFVDKQIHGPYRYWEHTHRFEKRDHGTYMEDVVRYAVPGFVFAPLVHFFFVRPRLEKIFSFREETLLRLLSE
jgi:ligand-binding SRPBCC domain-containing protein